MTDFKYRPDVDGLRGVAVALVLLFHANLAFPGGFVGVDVFFVISGFVITGLILKEKSENRFRLSDFWLRRIRRILPVSILVVFTTYIFGYYLLLPLDLIELSKSILAQQMLLSNIWFYRKTGYFEGNSEEMPLLHTWSLAVEEQFYLIYPFILVAFFRLPRKTSIFFAMAIFIASLAFSESKYVGANARFFFLPSRIWELLLGVGICFLPKPANLKTWHAEAFCLFGLAGIIAASLCFDSDTRFPGFHALLPCVSTAVIIYSGSITQSVSHKILASKPFVYFGLISFSLYMWHWPLLAMLRYINFGSQPSGSLRAIALVVSIALSILTYRFVETPFRNKKIFSKPRQVYLFASVSVTFLMALVGSTLYLNGIPNRFDKSVLAYAKFTKSSQFLHEMNVRQVSDGDFPTFGDLESERKCLIWGDSHAMALVPGLNIACKKNNIKGFQATSSSTAPLTGYFLKTRHGQNELTLEFNKLISDYAINQKFEFVILAGVWSHYLTDNISENHLKNTIEPLLSAGIKIIIVKDVPWQNGDVPKLLSLHLQRYKNADTHGVSLGDHAFKNQIANDIIDRVIQKNVLAGDPCRLLVDENGNSKIGSAGVSYYRDSHHLSVEGSLLLEPFFDSLFSSFK